MKNLTTGITTAQAIVLATVLALSPLSLTPVVLMGHSCQEDQPCWNCATMGNHVCGPRS